MVDIACVYVCVFRIAWRHKLGTIFLGVCQWARGSHTELGRQEFVQGCQGQIVESPQ